MKIIENRRLSRYDANTLAIRENWFTKADCEQYGIWLDMCEAKKLTANRLFTLASCVYEMSELPLANDYSATECIENIMFILAKEANTFFTIE